MATADDAGADSPAGEPSSSMSPSADREPTKGRRWLVVPLAGAVVVTGVVAGVLVLDGDDTPRPVPRGGVPVVSGEPGGAGRGGTATTRPGPVEAPVEPDVSLIPPAVLER